MSVYYNNDVGTIRLRVCLSHLFVLGIDHVVAQPYEVYRLILGSGNRVNRAADLVCLLAFSPSFRSTRGG